MLYSFFRGLASVLVKLRGGKVEGLENIPGEGAVIIAANHMSSWDPIVIGAVVKRPIHYMAKEELFDHEILAWLLKSVYAFPVKRGAPDRKAIKQALEILEQQQILGIFPEGTRSKTGELAKPHHGIAMLALKGNAAVIPAACMGAGQLFGIKKGPILVRFGSPLEYEEFHASRLSATALEDVSKDIMDKISDLLL